MHPTMSSQVDKNSIIPPLKKRKSEENGTHEVVTDQKTTHNMNCTPNSAESFKPAETLDYACIEGIAGHLLSRTKHRPQLGIVCGTGLGGLAESVTEKDVIPYSSIPNFPQSTVVGHAGNMVFGLLSDKPVVLMQGRFHLYEGYSPQKCTLAVRVMHLLGVKVLFVTNASGGINRSFKVGDVMLIHDHINLPGMAGMNPLVGRNDERFGVRFVAMSDAYDSDLLKLAHDCADSLKFSDHIRKGVYAMQMGPTFETIAECRMLQAMGADVVGMSTCPEVVVARHCGMRCFALSLVTNMVVLDHDCREVANHQEVMEVGKKRSVMVQRLVEEMVKRMSV